MTVPLLFAFFVAFFFLNILFWCVDGARLSVRTPTFLWFRMWFGFGSFIFLTFFFWFWETDLAWDWLRDFSPWLWPWLVFSCFLLFWYWLLRKVLDWPHLIADFWNWITLIMIFWVIDVKIIIIVVGLQPERLFLAWSFWWNVKIRRWRFFLNILRS